MNDFRFQNARGQWLTAVLAMVVGVSVVVGPWRSCSADLTGPTQNDRNITKIVTLFLQARHLSRRPLDDEISRRGFKLFIEALDPMKVYFFQSDIDEFRKYENQLDNMLKESDISFAYMVFKRFLQRVDERVATVDELLKGDFDFTRDEELITEPDVLHYPRNAEEARARWRKRLKYDLLVFEADKDNKDNKDKDKDKDPRKKIDQRYHSFARRMHMFGDSELLEMFLTAMTTAYDPHTTYMSKETLENFRIMLRLELEGIGAELREQDGKTIVKKVIPGGAADKAGQLKAEDQIVSVGQGEDGELVDVVGQKLTDVVKLVRGEAGTIVRLGVIPTGSNKVVTYKITRAKIELKDEAAQSKIFAAGTKSNGKPYRIGLVDLHSFYMDMQAAQRNEPNYRSTTRDVRHILDQFNQENVDAVVLDLRRNGGGSLIEAINLTGLFVDRGPIVQVMGASNRVDHYDDMEPGMVWRGPLIVLTSKFSASASEILAGAIQDYRRGLIIGDESTHGKGTVQSLLDLGKEIADGPRAPELGALKITQQQFFRPNGDSTQKRGVLSDIVLPSVTNYMDVSESDLDYAVDFKQVPKGSFHPTDMVTPEIVAKLRADSEHRLHDSKDFAKRLKRIELYRKQKAKKGVTLNEKQFLAERAELNAQKEDEKLIKQQAKNDNAIKRDYYLNEVFGITIDYIKALHESKLARVN